MTGGYAGAAVVVLGVVAYFPGARRWWRWTRETHRERGTWIGTAGAWRAEPRPPLSGSRTYSIGVAVVVPVVLIGLGLIVLFGPHQSFRIGGVLSLLAAATVLAVEWLYLERPVS